MYEFLNDIRFDFLRHGWTLSAIEHRNSLIRRNKFLLLLFNGREFESI
jgi:hypothetical protein